MDKENFEKILDQRLKNHIYSKIEQGIMERDFKDEDFDEIDTYKRIIEKDFNKLICDVKISDFSLDFDNDVDENGILTVDAQVSLNSPVRDYSINKSDFPELSNEEFVEMCNEIKSEITKGLGNEQPVWVNAHGFLLLIF